MRTSGRWMSLFGLFAAALAPACIGNVTIGDGSARIDTGVPNLSVGGMSVNALIVDTAPEGARYANHGGEVAGGGRR